MDERMDTHGVHATGSDSGKKVIGKVISVSGAEAEILMRATTVAQAVDPNIASVPGQIGTVVKMQVGDSWVYGSVRSVRSPDDNPDSAVQIVNIDFIGQAVGGEVKKLSRGISNYPIPGLPVLSANDSDLESLYYPGDQISLHVGTVYPTRSVPAQLVADGLLSKHFAVLGSTGTGKSSTVSLLVHEMVKAMPHGHILILDPHNEYTEAFADCGEHADTANFSLPYWLMNLEEHIQVFIGPRSAEREIEVDILKRCLVAARKKSQNSREFDKITVDTPAPYKLTDLLEEINNQLGKLDKPEGQIPFMRLRNKIEELRTDPRYSFMFSGLLIADNLTEIVARILRFPSMGRPVSTLDLSGVPSDIVDVVVSVLCRMMFDFAMWSRREGNARPLLLICEEAHRYVPNEKHARFDAARRSLERIAKEGRKYGVSLGLVSQRPSDLSESVLSQCGTILSMRMNNDRDRRFVESAMPENAQGMLESLPALQNQECIICGEGVASPMRVKLKYLSESLRPSSDDPNFAFNWQREVSDRDYVRRVIQRWRSNSK